MTNEKVLEEVKKLKEKYPDTKQILISYYGSGDSFEGFNVEIDGVYTDTIYDEVGNLVDALTDRVGSDFNNDGSRGDITIDLVNEKVKIEDYYYVTEAVLNDTLEI